MENILLTYDEAAEILRLTPRQVMRLVRRGELPSVLLPNREVRFDPDDIRRWIDTCKQPADGQGGGK